MLRWIVMILVLAAVVAGAAYWNSQQSVPVDVAVAETGTMRVWIEERAKTHLPHVHRVSMPLAGRIRQITLQEGDPVTAGQTVAEMDPADLETELAEATARVGLFRELLRSLQATVEAAQEQLVASQAKAEFAEREFKRKSSLAETNSISESERHAAELLQVESKVDHTQDTLTLRAVEAIHQAFELSRQEAQEAQQRRQRDRNRATLTSPIDGVVLARHVSNERVLQAGEVLLEIGRLEELEVEAEVLTQDAVTIPSNAAVDIEGPAIGPVPIRGRVKRIEPQAFTKISSLGVEEQRVRVAIAFDPDSISKWRENGRRLGVDYRVRVKIYTDQQSNVLKVPRSALFRSGTGTWQAFVVRDNRAQRVDLEIGLSNDFEVEVRSGLQAEDRVILAPESSLNEGDRVASRERMVKSQEQ